MKGRILVAGGAGFIGSHLVERLLAEGFQVTVLDNLVSGSLMNLEHLKGREGLEFQKRDIVDNLSDLSGVSGFNAVFHLAAIANPKDYERHPMESLTVNSLGTRNLLEVAERSRARFIYFSSSEVYGHHEPVPVDGLTEETQSRLFLNQSRSPYFVGKIFGEELTTHYCEKAGLDYILIRPFNIYGPRMDPNTKYGRVIPNFIKWGIAGKPLVINGDGTQERSFCHVADLIECLSRIISNKTLATRVLNVGCRETIKILELAQLINKLTGNNAGHTFDIRHKYEPSYRTPNIDRAKAWLDWSPKVRLKDGLEVLIALNRGGYSQ